MLIITAAALLLTAFIVYNLYIRDKPFNADDTMDAVELGLQELGVPEQVPSPTLSAAATTPEPISFNTPEPTPTPSPSPSLTPTQLPTPAPSPSPAPVPTPSPKVANPKFDELLERNKDVIGWIYIENTKIDYPVLHDGTNDYYLAHDIDGNKTVAASIFMDATNVKKRDNYNTLLHGHNMKNGSMFADVARYKNESFFRDQRHSIIYFDTLYDEMVWEVFSVYVVDADTEFMYTNFISPDSFLNMAKFWQERSFHKVEELVLIESDRVLTLNTCSYETGNSRTLVHARLIYKNSEKVAEPYTGFVLGERAAGPYGAPFQK